MPSVPMIDTLKDLAYWLVPTILASLLALLLYVGFIVVVEADTQSSGRYLSLDSLHSTYDNGYSNDESVLCQNPRPICYQDGAWCEDWGKRTKLNHYVIDMETLLVYEFRNRHPDGALFVLVWRDWLPGADGNPHPESAWWCDG